MDRPSQMNVNKILFERIVNFCSAKPKPHEKIWTAVEIENAKRPVFNGDADLTDEGGRRSKAWMSYVT